jgi:hypothetical protein
MNRAMNRRVPLNMQKKVSSELHHQQSIGNPIGKTIGNTIGNT